GPTTLLESGALRHGRQCGTPRWEAHPATRHPRSGRQRRRLRVERVTDCSVESGPNRADVLHRLGSMRTYPQRVALCGALLMLAVAGCSSNEQKSSTSTPPATTSTSE